MADRQVPGILVLLLVMLAVAAVALAVLWAAVFDVGSLALILGFVVYFLVAHVYLPYWTHRDARARGSRYPTGWTALAFFFPFVGLGIYLLATRRPADLSG